MLLINHKVMLRSSNIGMEGKNALDTKKTQKDNLGALSEWTDLILTPTDSEYIKEKKPGNTVVTSDLTCKRYIQVTRVPSSIMVKKYRYSLVVVGINISWHGNQIKSWKK